jgi:hypothetical protein
MGQLYLQFGPLAAHLWRSASAKLVQAPCRRRPVCKWTCFGLRRTLHGLSGYAVTDPLIGPNDRYRKQVLGVDNAIVKEGSKMKCRTASNTPPALNPASRLGHTSHFLHSNDIRINFNQNISNEHRDLRADSTDATHQSLVVLMKDAAFHPFQLTTIHVTSGIWLPGAEFVTTFPTAASQTIRRSHHYTARIFFIARE